MFLFFTYFTQRKNLIYIQNNDFILKTLFIHFSNIDLLITMDNGENFTKFVSDYNSETGLNCFAPL